VAPYYSHWATVGTTLTNLPLRYPTQYIRKARETVHSIQIEFVCLHLSALVCYMSRSKHWCFTLNNYTQSEYEQTLELLEQQTTYGIVGKEKGHTGTPHLQGYCVFHSRKRLSQVKQLLSRAHWEKAKGSPRQNQTYCSKEGDFAEFGDCPGGQGTRTDLAQLHADIKAGKTMQEIQDKHWAAYLKYHRAIQHAILLRSKVRDWEVDVRVYWGTTGLGKTRRAIEEAAQDVYIHSGEKWFDGYDGGDAIFDDFGGSEFKLTYLLKLLDRYPMRVPVKGGYVQWKPKRIWITSNRSPDDWYPNAHSEHIVALRRRFTQVIHFEDPFNQ
jgi:hypothetical protein